MTSGIEAPAAGAVDGAAGLPVEGVVVVGGALPDGPVVCPDDPPPGWEQPATSNDAAISTAIRIPPG
ncbi:hypothetical protein MSAS_10000 [Mycobacterium saskatchewanense]|nr:hypothetical protein MSAS_10000 [Mycobacterium saskatchewanense]